MTLSGLKFKVSNVYKILICFIVLRKEINTVHSCLGQSNLVKMLPELPDCLVLK
jgi:hypothetical protein